MFEESEVPFWTRLTEPPSTFKHAAGPGWDMRPVALAALVRAEVLRHAATMLATADEVGSYEVYKGRERGPRVRAATKLHAAGLRWLKASETLPNLPGGPPQTGWIKGLQRFDFEPWSGYDGQSSAGVISVIRAEWLLRAAELVRFSAVVLKQLEGEHAVAAAAQRFARAEQQDALSLK
jgi:hypothetical protein